MFFVFPQIERATTLTTIFFVYNEIMNWVREILKHYNLDEEFSDQQVLLFWNDVVGSQLARMTRATRLSNGTLTVEVASPIVSQELNLLKQNYIDLLNERMGRDVLQRIRFVPGRFPRPPIPLVTAESDPSVGNLALSGIDDAHLRDSFNSLYRTQRRREHAMLKAGARRCPRCGVVFFGNEEICPGCQFDEIADKQ
ncbi:MAG TPA: DUF721 domain-containing protein [Candidatus Acetothermia bacterium]|nr:DUF721 domain-containing protein [Candidatus Acetothermia bacterium]